jgi:hypothetical protein
MTLRTRPVRKRRGAHGTVPSALAVAAGLVTALALAGCSAGGSSGVTVPATVRDSAGTVWLCRPGMANDPCAFSLATTAVAANGKRTATTFAGIPPRAAAGNFDCFYVYPTVSLQDTGNTSLAITKAEVDAAIDQAAPFSRVCNVFAPMYRSATWPSVDAGLKGNQSVLRGTFTVGFDSVLSAWNDFLAHYDNGRPIILIGDSQGSAILIHLIATQIDGSPALRRRLLVAIIAGGNLQVPAGKTVGATFKHVPLCTSPTETGCAIAYSSFPGLPPSDALFGRAGQGVSLQSEQTTVPGDQVACVNPAALGGGTSDLMPYFLAFTQVTLSPAITSGWVTYPGLYNASCESQQGATWLQVSYIGAFSDTRPAIAESLGPAWGYHGEDVGLALGNLIRDVAGEETAWAAVHD